MIKTIGTLTFPSASTRGVPRSVSDDPNYNPAMFAQGPKTDFFGLGRLESMHRREREAQARQEKAEQEAISGGSSMLGGFIPTRARTAQPGSSDFRDVLNSMGYARGGKVVRQADGSLKSFNPVRLGERDYYQEYMDRQSGPPQKAAAPKPLANPDGSPTNLDPNRDFRRGYDRFIGSLTVDGGLDDSDKISIRNYLSSAVLGGQINPYFARELGKKSQLNTLNQNQKQLTDRQKFNLDTFQRAAPGTRFGNNSGFGVVRSNSLLGKTANMQPPVNLSFIGSQY
jgi:hypothetical protein